MPVCGVLMMRGHVYQRGKTWTYVIDLPRDPITGKRRQKSKGGFKTEKEAWAACRNEIIRIERGQNTQDENMLYRDFLKIWLEEYAKSKLKPTTYENNKQIIDTRIIPELGNLKLRELTPLRIQRFYNKILATYSPDYVKTIHSVVSKTLRQAYKWDMLSTNIMEKVDPPRVPKKEMKIWTLDQCQKFLETCKGHQMYIVFSLAIWTGMRRGEILGLRWKDIDLENKTISVQQTLSWTPTEGIIFQDTKTARSNRSIVIPDILLADLKTHKKLIAEQKIANGNKYQDYGLVCCLTDGRPIKPRYLLEHFDDLIKKAGLPKIRFHDLRHTHATLLIHLKVHPKIAAERLGQSTSMFTDRYAHVIESMQKEVAASIDRAVNNLWIKS